MNHLPLALLGLIVFLPSASAQLVVYNNSVNDLDRRLISNTSEVGDEIILAGTYRTATSFTFQYFCEDFTGSELVRVRFYRNDAPVSPNDPPAPGTVLWDSGGFNVPATERATIEFTDFTSDSVVPLTSDLPNSFTWTVQFSGLGPSAKAGVDLYGPPVIGDNFSDFWDFTGNSWSLKTGPTDMSFGAVLTAIPEPASYSLVAALLTLGWCVQKRRTKH